MSIDDKLREIVSPTAYGFVKYDVCPECMFDFKNAIPLIKQAFADEGYVQFKYEPGAKVFTEEEGLQLLLDKGFMTGQEWYDRFEKLANSYPPYEPIKSPRLLALELARKAAGLE